MRRVESRTMRRSGTGAAEAGAVGEPAIVGEHGADAGEDGVGDDGAFAGRGRGRARW